MSARMDRSKTNNIVAVGLVAGALGLIASLGWPLGWVGALGAGMLALLHYTTPNPGLKFHGMGFKRRAFFAASYALALALLVGSVAALLMGH